MKLYQLNQRICNYNKMVFIIFTISNFANAEVRMNVGIGQPSTRSWAEEIIGLCRQVKMTVDIGTRYKILTS